MINIGNNYTVKIENVNIFGNGIIDFLSFYYTGSCGLKFGIHQSAFVTEKMIKGCTSLLTDFIFLHTKFF